MRSVRLRVPNDLRVHIVHDLQGRTIFIQTVDGAVMLDVGDWVAPTAPDTAPIYQLDSSLLDWQYYTSVGYMARRSDDTWQAMVDFNFIEQLNELPTHIQRGSIIMEKIPVPVIDQELQLAADPLKRISRYSLLLEPFP